MAGQFGDCVKFGFDTSGHGGDFGSAKSGRAAYYKEKGPVMFQAQ